MARKPAPGTRDKILQTATHLFYDHGVHAVGQQQVVDACGCGKNLLYREFASKDDLVVAYLECCRRDWLESIDRASRALADDPAGQLLAIVRVAAERVAAPDYRGCPFQNVLAEFPDPAHPVHRISVDHRVEVRSHVRTLAERCGARDPELLADRLMLIVDGVYANGTIGGSAAAATAVAFAEEIVATALAPRPA